MLFQEEEKPKAATNKTPPPAAKPEAAIAAKPAPVAAAAAATAVSPAGAASPPLKKPMSPPKAVKTPKASIVQRKRKAEKGWLWMTIMGLRYYRVWELQRKLQTLTG